MIDVLELWLDEQHRDGFANMAVDDYFLENATVPLLRVYAWHEGWGSIGYFSSYKNAREDFPGIMHWVRRSSGGGVVDHRNDWTYSLIVPKEFSLAQMKGGESYNLIHSALQKALLTEQISTFLCGENRSAGANCFTNPVVSDLLDDEGKKIAGAGQRRTRHGLLHQGSVSVVPSNQFAHCLANALSKTIKIISPTPSEQDLTIFQKTYLEKKWLEKR